MKSYKEKNLDDKLTKKLSGKVLITAELLIEDEEIHILQEQANNVSIKRLGYNDHGPVHMRQVAINAMKMMRILKESGLLLSLEDEGVGNCEDSGIAVLLASFLHDVGMSVGRDNHEEYSIILALPIIERILKKVYPNDLKKQVIVKSTAIEGIAGHMATKKIHSIEAGIILIADGCDMEQGRARIPLLLSTSPAVGDIHRYSASSIQKVSIKKGEKRPIKIQIEMTETVGFFQVEEVLFRKINHSPIKPLIELYAGLIGDEMKCYL